VQGHPSSLRLPSELIEELSAEETDEDMALHTTSGACQKRKREARML